MVPAEGSAAGGGLERLLSAAEVAGVLGLCRDTVYRMCADGEIEHVRVRNQIRIPAAALRRLIEGK